MTVSIAGHYFALMPDGRRVCTCGKTWVDLVASRELWDVGVDNVAHGGLLNEAELAQLYAEEERIWGLVHSLATGT